MAKQFGFINRDNTLWSNNSRTSAKDLTVPMAPFSVLPQSRPGYGTRITVVPMPPIKQCTGCLGLTEGDGTCFRLPPCSDGAGSRVRVFVDNTSEAVAEYVRLQMDAAVGGAA